MVYVYIIRDPRDGCPYYVGIGSKGRVQMLRRNAYTNNVTAQIRAAGFEPVVFVVTTHKSRKAAGRMERSLIRRYGRRDINTGMLTNLTDGGDTNGVMSPAARERMSVRLRGRVSPMKGRKHSAEFKAKMSARMLGNTHGRALCGIKKTPQHVINQQRACLLNSRERHRDSDS